MYIKTEEGVIVGSKKRTAGSVKFSRERESKREPLLGLFTLGFIV